jgi:hypothetical protein
MERKGVDCANSAAGAGQGRDFAIFAARSEKGVRLEAPKKFTPIKHD